MTDQQPPIELIPAEASEVEVTTGGDDRSIHAWARTIAVVVTAAAVAWAATAAVAVRDAAQSRTCLQEIQAVEFSPSSEMTAQEIGERLVDRAESCDLHLLADSIRQSYENG